MKSLMKERSATMENHVTIGVYINGECKINIVPPEDLHEHVSYNLRNRFGRALFVDGKCLYNGGYMTEQDTAGWEKKIAAMKIDTSVASEVYT